MGAILGIKSVAKYHATAGCNEKHPRKKYSPLQDLNHQPSYAQNRLLDLGA